MTDTVLDLVCLRHYWEGLRDGVLYATLAWITILLLWRKR